MRKDYLTPPELAKRWGVKSAKVLTLIRSGELEAINLASNPTGRPRFRVTVEAIKKFEKRRAATAAPKQPKRYRKPTRKGFVEYF